MNLFKFFSFSFHAHNEIAENGADKVLSSEEENSSVHKTYVNFLTSRKSALDVPLYAISFLFSFFCRGLQMCRNFLTTCTTLGTRGEKLQADAALCGRIAKNGADAKPCLSDVYKSGTRARRRQADATLCGRSMVEMLGVLAIIGVLSVGVISGYSKAMMKYKLNRQTEQIGSILDYVLINSDKFNHDTSIAFISLLYKLNAIPVEMIREDWIYGYVYDIFGNKVYLNEGNDGNNIYYSLSVSIGKYSREICMNLYQMAKLRSANLWQTVFNKDTQSSSIQHTNRVWGDSYCGKTYTCLKDLSLTQMDELCSACDDSQTYCRFYILWGRIKP